MPNSAWIEREERLPRCPLPRCRRAGTCLHPDDKDPCRRLYVTRDAFYRALARKIDRLREEVLARRPPGMVVEVAEPGSPEFERRMKFLYDLLRAADQADSKREMAEIAARKKQGEKPASAGGA